MQTIYLDISNKGVVPTIYAKQGDVGRKFLVVLTDSGIPYAPPAGSVFSAWYKGDSGEGNYTDIGEKSAFSVSGNKVTVEMISQMLSNDGDGVLSLVLNDPNGNQISTWNIPYFCEPVPGAGSEEAKNYYTAFSQAVENLPYPDASLSVSGKAADAAATGKALEGKAPAGYGLGEVKEMANEDDCLENGWYAVGNYSIFVQKLSDDFIYQVARSTKNDAEMTIETRQKLYGVWQPWEWVNPSMVEGVEYRTTERWNGKVVYAKAISFGNLPNKSSASVNHGMSLKEVLGAWGADSNGANIPRSVCTVDAGSGSIKVTTTSDLSSRTAVIAMKYTRD